MDLPPPVHFADEKMVCILAAAQEYRLPSAILLAVASIERGKAGQWVKNRNGTFDVGVMQFNTVFLNSLNKYGIQATHVASNSCYPYQLAAWRIKRHIEFDSGSDYYSKVANYHSKTPKYNIIYRNKLISYVEQWNQWFRSKSSDKAITNLNVQVKAEPGRKQAIDHKSIESSEKINKVSLEIRTAFLSNFN